MQRITINDIIDLLDYDRTGIRQVRIVEEKTGRTDLLQTNSYLLVFIGESYVNTLDTVGGVITLHVDYKGAEDGKAEN